MTSTIVGAQGFVGARLRARLQTDGRPVWAPPRGDPELFKRDLGTVYYCAGLTADFAQRPFDTVEAHVRLLSEILERARFDRLVYLSSTRLYDTLPPGAEGAETAALSLSPANPRALYDLSKALGENLTITQSGGRGRVARLANVFDWEPGAPGFLSEWLQRAATERAMDLASSPAVARDYIHLDDVVASLVALASSPEPLTVNVASGELVSNAQLAEVFRAAGWVVSFQAASSPPPPPQADTAALVALGVRPRAVLDLVRAHLERLAS